jgi:hypothetical protein
LSRWMITTGHIGYWTDAINYPHGVNILDNASDLFIGFLAFPLTATIGPVATFDVLLRIVIVGSFCGMCLALRMVGISRFAALVGSVFYASSPFIFKTGPTYLF